MRRETMPGRFGSPLVLILVYPRLMLARIMPVRPGPLISKPPKPSNKRKESSRQSLCQLAATASSRSKGLQRSTQTGSRGE